MSLPFRPERPFDGPPKLPPPQALETPAVLKACIRARVALAELNAITELISNPTILINLLPILEARASSEIENMVTTTDRLFSSRAMTLRPRCVMTPLQLGREKLFLHRPTDAHDIRAGEVPEYGRRPRSLAGVTPATAARRQSGRRPAKAKFRPKPP